MGAAVREQRRRRSCWRTWRLKQANMYRDSRNTDRRGWGAPITAYNRISSSPITVHSNIYEPDYVVVVDESLLDSIDVTRGLNPEGAVIINSTRSRDEIEEHLHGYQGAVYLVDAKAISIKALGKNYPNSPMLAAAVAVSKVMERGEFLREMSASFQHKFAKKPEVIDGNVMALEMAFDAVK